MVKPQICLLLVAALPAWAACDHGSSEANSNVDNLTTGKTTANTVMMSPACVLALHLGGGGGHNVTKSFWSVTQCLPLCQQLDLKTMTSTFLCQHFEAKGVSCKQTACCCRIFIVSVRALKHSQHHTKTITQVVMTETSAASLKISLQNCISRFFSYGTLDEKQEKIVKQLSEVATCVCSMIQLITVPPIPSFLE